MFNNYVRFVKGYKNTVVKPSPLSTFLKKGCAIVLYDIGIMIANSYYYPRFFDLRPLLLLLLLSVYSLYELHDHNYLTTSNVTILEKNNISFRHSLFLLHGDSIGFLDSNSPSEKCIVVLDGIGKSATTTHFYPRSIPLPGIFVR